MLYNKLDVWNTSFVMYLGKLIMILSILVDTFFTRILMPAQRHPEMGMQFLFFDKIVLCFPNGIISFIWIQYRSSSVVQHLLCVSGKGRRRSPCHSVISVLDGSRVWNRLYLNLCNHTRNLCILIF